MLITSASHSEAKTTATASLGRSLARAGQKVLMVDDVLATGGTMQAGAKLIEQAGGEVYGCAFLVELSFLGGRGKLQGYDVYSVLRY